MPPSSPNCTISLETCETAATLTSLRLAVKQVEEQYEGIRKVQGRQASALLEQDRRIRYVEEGVAGAKQEADRARHHSAETVQLMKALSDSVNTQFRESDKTSKDQFGVLKEQTVLLKNHGDTLGGHSDALAVLKSAEDARAARETQIDKSNKTTAEWLRWSITSALVLLLALIGGISYIISHLPGVHP